MEHKPTKEWSGCINDWAPDGTDEWHTKKKAELKKQMCELIAASGLTAAEVQRVFTESMNRMIVSDYVPFADR